MCEGVGEHVCVKVLVNSTVDLNGEHMCEGVGEHGCEGVGEQYC